MRRATRLLTVLLVPIFTAPYFAADSKTDAARYQDTANKLIDAALADSAGLNRLEYLCYRIGNRLSGSAALDRAIAWGADEMKKAGLANVHTIPVKVPRWVRGHEAAEMVEPLQKPLALLGLGGSVATPAGGITAEVAAVSSFDELEKLGKRGVEGKIVVYDAPFVSYEKTVAYRRDGASRAARFGAVAALVRSITPRSLRDPHTGGMHLFGDRSEDSDGRDCGGRREVDTRAHAHGATGANPSGDGSAYGGGRGFSGCDRGNCGAGEAGRGRGGGRAYRFMGCGTGRARRWRRRDGGAGGGGDDQEAGP